MRVSTLHRSSSFRAWLAAAFAALMLLGCGGGGGGGDGGATVAILDSFGQVVSDGDGGIGAGDSGADGTAGEGKPIVGARVQGQTRAARPCRPRPMRRAITGSR